MFKAYIDFIKGLFAHIPFNLFDYVVFVAFAFYIVEDVSFGLISSAISLTATLSAFFIGLILYPQVSSLLINQLSFTKGIGDAVGFLITVGISFIITSIIFSQLRKKYIYLKFPKKVDMLGGAIFGAMSFFFIASFAVSLLLSFPTSGVIKDFIRNSVTARFLFTRTQGMDTIVRNIFGGAINDTINFLTVKPGSDQSVSLNFRTTSYKLDIVSEKRMLELVNRERAKNGRASLFQDDSLTQVALVHAKDMLTRGYFSHYTPEGLSPFDRMAEAGIVYQYAGENLAFAPDVEIAMDGLMKSPGHRENILSPDFGKVGIGVLDAGIYGKMFVQEFTD